jgi:hypothetical protein
MPTTTINLTGQALSKVDDTNVTLLLGGTPLTALLKATSIAVGWTGQLAPSRGGTGLGSLGTANQLLRVNAGATALEYFTPSFGTGTVTTASVVSANGFTGTVANQTTTPAITLTTSITGVLIGNGTALTTSAELTWNGTTKDFSVGDATKATLNVLGSAEIVEINSVNGLSVSNAAGTNEWLFVDPASSTGGFGDLSASGNGSTLIFDDTTQTLRWNKSILGIRGVDYTFPAANASGVLTNNGAGVLSWAASGSGITAGTTTVTSGTSGDVLMNIGGVVGSATATVNRAYRLDVGTPFNSFFNFGAGQAVGYNNTTALRNSSFSYNALSALTTGDDNTCFGYQSGIFITTQNNNTYFGSSAGQNTGSNNTGVGYLANNGGSASSNTAIGYSSMSAGTTSGTGNNAAFGASSLLNATSGIRNTALGAESLFTLTSGSYNVAIGFEASYTGNLSGTLGIGYFANPVTSNTGVIGSNQAESRLDAIYFNGATSSGGSIYDIILSGSGGSGSNASSANMSLQGGAPTGTSTTGGALNLRGYTALGSGSTAQTATTVLQITNATTVTVSNAVNFVFNATTGTKLGTATTQKIGFWNAAPIVQPTTAIASAAVVSGTGGNVKHDDTFDGYTVEQVVKALRNIGLLA